MCKETMASPRFSVVLPVYNGEEYLREALASLRWQTLADWECICINDGSYDGSGEILEQFAAFDQRFRIFHQPNAGIVASLNRGIREARAAWIARMDADDIALPDRLAIQWDFVTRHPETLVLSSYMACIDAAGLPIGVQYGPTNHSEIENQLLVGNNTINHPTVVMQRDAVINVGMYRQEFEWVEDADLWLRLARQGVLATVPRVLLKYRMHDRSVCSTRSDVQPQIMKKLLVAAHEERGLLPSATGRGTARTSQQKRAPASHRWARRAARSGYYQTAWNYLRRQMQHEPLSLTNIRAAIEVGVRVIGAVIQGKRPPRLVLPDWREWDPSTVDPKQSTALQP